MQDVCDPYVDDLINVGKVGIRRVLDETFNRRTLPLTSGWYNLTSHFKINNLDCHRMTR
jgi:hypothetical protein